MQTRQVPVALGATLLVAVLAGCASSAPVSLLEAYEAHAEQTVCTTSSPAAADAVGAYLVAERWEDEVTVDQGGDVPNVDVYRLIDGGEEWVVLVSWDSEQDLVITVQSPVTVRGDHKDD